MQDDVIVKKKETKNGSLLGDCQDADKIILTKPMLAVT